MNDALISTQEQFDELCQHIADAGIVAFDTEFISERTYVPELCLLQFATRDRCVAVDPQQVPSLDAWWDLMCNEQTTVVAHAAREEIRFCVTKCNRRPKCLVDVQVAEGLLSRGYPLSHDSLLERVLGQRLRGTETRTDWRHRPLTDRQIEYALDDVRFLLAVWDRQKQSLQSQNRLAWAESEFARVVDEVAAERNQEGWKRLSGLHKLRPRELVVARELCRWREDEANKRNRPLRSILRDDLIVELAKRQPRTKHELLATRDMNRPSYKRSAQAMAECINRALDIPKSDWPERPKHRNSQVDEHVLSRLLSVALANRCAELNVSMSLVGTSADLRDLVRWHTEPRHRTSTPRLMQGWRVEVCGDFLVDILDGKIGFRVANPASDHPLVFEDLSPGR